MKNSGMYRPLYEADPQIAAAIDNETRRQHEGLELIASENFVSEAVLECRGAQAELGGGLRTDPITLRLGETCCNLTIRRRRSPASGSRTRSGGIAAGLSGITAR